MRKINHHAYHLPELTDLAVLRQQAERRRDKNGEVSIVHDHQHFIMKEGDPRAVVCTDKCMIYIPGEPTRPVSLQEARSR